MLDSFHQCLSHRGTIATHRANGLPGQQVRQSARHQGAHYRVADARRHGHSSLGQSIFTLPPTRHELALESAQTFKIVEAPEMTRRQIEGALGDVVLSRNVVRTVS